MSANSTGSGGPGVYVAPTPGNREKRRASNLLATLAVINESSCEPDKYYAQWAGGFVEYICPSDLLGVACEWDEILLEGCSLVRLCKSVAKYTTHVCPDGDARDPGNPPRPRSCGHIHHEIDISCRYIATHERNSYRHCNQVLVKNRLCSAGHDFEVARASARAAHDEHKRRARAAGSVGRVKFGWTF